MEAEPQQLILRCADYGTAAATQRRSDDPRYAPSDVAVTEAPDPVPLEGAVMAVLVRSRDD